MDFEIDAKSDQAPFEQIRTQVRIRAESGDLRVGDRLPPIRTLATSLGLAAGTVARAYSELEADGVVETRGRAGTVIAASAVRTETATRQAAEIYVDAIRALGIPDAAAVRAIRTALKSTPGRSNSQT